MLRYLLLLMLLLASPARADDIAATGRGVVRIVTIAVVDGQVVGFGHGSGFAIAPDRIVTNAHVVELAQRYPDNVVIGVVPSEGTKSFQGRLVAFDARADLALVQFTGTRLPPVTLFTGGVGEGDAVVALGYPGNVDLATARSAADYIRPIMPIRSEGVFSGRRSLTGIEVLLHTAAIARGNSGGPLLDPCGRVIGTNSAITRGEEGDSSFGFAIAETELARFLRAAEQPFASVASPCVPFAERLRADAEADARAAATAVEAKRDAAQRATLDRLAALERARAQATRERENIMGLAALLLVGGALAMGAAGMLEGRGRREAALWAAGAGTVAIIAAIAVFILRPSPEAILPRATTALAPVVADTPPGQLQCTFDAGRSRVITSSTPDVTLDWSGKGCMGKTQYVAANGRWERILVPENEQTVSVLGFDPATGAYTNTRYFVSAAQMTAARAARGTTPGACSAKPDTIARLAERQSAIRAVLPPLPNEKLAYTCRRG
ncbi:MAG TPA: trypsin-like peptidase domain-containing protein [Sphingomonas sp.]